MKTAQPKELPTDQCGGYKQRGSKLARCTAKAVGTLTNPLGHATRTCKSCATPHLTGQSRGMGWRWIDDLHDERKD